MNLLRPFLLVAGLLAIWQFLVLLTGVPAYIIPGPMQVARAMSIHFRMFLPHLGITLAEILAGLARGTLLGAATALAITASSLLKRWLLPLLVISQAIPVFALAPVLVLWLGYGMASKVAMAVLIIFFPVTAAFHDGMRRVNPDLLDLAQIMGARRTAVFRHIIIPSALPSFASGMRVATAVAPIGAVVGEWVGSSAGLGYVMLHANGRMQIDIMFAALTLLTALSLVLYFLVDRILNRIVYWHPNQGQ
jgi:putative hydroxymethylpyrimidine transport system permease protein